MRIFAIRAAALPCALMGLLSASAHAYDYTAPVPLATIASFDPSNSIVPFPTDLLRQGSKDLTINAPVPTDPASAGPVNALNALDGFSTTAPWSTSFSTSLTPSSVVGGSSVRMFEVSTDAATGAVTGVKAELKSPQQFVATLASNATTGATLAIVPTAPLKQLTSYMVVVTNGITSATGTPVRSSLIYGLSKRTTPLCSGGASTLPALPAAEACALEPLRQLVNLQEAAASAAGVSANNIVISWTATTQSTTIPMQVLAGATAAVPNTQLALVPTGINLGQVNAALPPIADVYVGDLPVPYYLSEPSAANPTAPLTGYWHAAPGAYVAPYDKAGLDPTSTNVTFANPLPVATDTVKIPVLATLPNASSGKTKPAAGWPVVIFQHGITRNRTDAFAIAGALAQAGYAVVAIDLPLHGLTDPTNPFFHNQLVANTPASFVVAPERTFDLDFENNATGAAGPDGVIDGSGTYFINLTSLLTSRDNLRQGVADLLQLRTALNTFSLDGTPMFDHTRVAFVGQSLGSIEGTSFLALAQGDTLGVNTGVLSVPGGGITNLLLGSPTFAPQILGGLAAAGLKPGTAAFNSFIVVTQTVIDSGDPINYASMTAGKGILVHEVVGGSAPLAGDSSAASLFDASGKWLPDQVIPNSVANAPLSGTEPLIAVLGLPAVTSSTQSTDGTPVRGAVRFVAGTHGSLLDPSASPQTTVEMQTEMATYVASGGLALPVSNTAVVKH